MKKVVVFITFFFIVTFQRQANALIYCTPFDYNGIQQCEVGIDSNLAYAMAIDVGGQQASQWCWAACIEMVFSYYGYRISQERIVEETYGSIVNLPLHISKLLASLNRPWVDDNGQSFTVRSDSYTANPITASQDLANNAPLIILTMGHYMVLTSMTYLHDVYGNGDVTTATVQDPWPGNGIYGRRILSPQEWYSTVSLARIRIIPATDTEDHTPSEDNNDNSNETNEDTTSSPPSENDDGGNGCFINILLK